MGCWAKITTQYTDESIVVCEVGSDAPANPDLLDELVSRVVRLFDQSVNDGADAEAEDD